MAGPLLRLDDVGLAYHSRRGIQAVLQHISFSLAQGEHLTVSGPSGCGKSTLLRLIAGLQAPTEGQIYFAGQKMTAPRPDLAIVFQDYGLFPWKTVEENILLPGRLHGSPLDKDQLASLLDTLGLTAVRHHYPGELSGGQKQRTALGRAMAMQPKLLLPATTALGTILPDGRERGLAAGANVVMPNLSPLSVRKKYALYDGKLCTGEEAAQCIGCLSRRVQSVGANIVIDRGDVKS